MQNENWFNAMVEFRNTMKYIIFHWNVPRAIAQEIQHAAAMRKSQAECDAIAAASTQLRNQIGF